MRASRIEQRPARRALELAHDVAPFTIAGLVVFVLLTATVTADPTRGVTISNAPFSDEAWNVVNARNLVLLGTWSTDDWNRQLVTLPFNIAEAAAFAIGGVGIVQARMVSILSVAVATALVGWTARRMLGRGPGLIGAIAFAGSSLVLYYGRLAFLEPMQTLFLVAAAATLPSAAGRHSARAGVVAGAMLALAIGTKADAIFPAVGLLAGAAITGARQSAVRRWIAAAVLVIGLAAGIWLAAIWLPNREAVGLMLQVWFGHFANSAFNPADLALEYVRFSDGAFYYLAPLLVGGVVTLVLTVISWRRLVAEARQLIGVALGWVVVGWGSLFLVIYSPNRYLVQLVPGFALLAAAGASVTMQIVARRPIVTRLVGAVAALGLVLPGALIGASWLGSATSTLPALQARVQTIIPAGSVVEGGYAPLIAMDVKGVVLFTNFGTNPGDLYAERGVRWLVLEPGEQPSWAAKHPAAWAGRELMLTAPWGPTTLDLYRLQ